MGMYYIEQCEIQGGINYLENAYDIDNNELLDNLQNFLVEISCQNIYEKDINDIKKILEFIDNLNEQDIDIILLKKYHILMKGNFLLGNIEKAKEYLKLIEEQSVSYEDLDYKYYAGRIYLYSNVEKAKQYFNDILPKLEKEKEDKLKLYLKNISEFILNDRNLEYIKEDDALL